MSSIEECTTSKKCESCKNKAICSHTTKTVIEYNEKLKLDAAKIDAEIKAINEKPILGHEDHHILNDLCTDAADIAWKLNHPWKAETCECGGRFVCDDDMWSSRKRCDGVGCMDYDDLSADAHIHYETVCNEDCQMFRWGECAGDGKFIKHRFDDHPVCAAGLLDIEELPATQDNPNVIYPDQRQIEMSQEGLEPVEELKEYVVIGIHKENCIAALSGTFDTMEEATTFTGVEAIQPEGEGVTFSIYRRVD